MARPGTCRLTAMKVVFIYGKPVSSALTKFFTGSSCYHVGFTDGVKFWDMNLIRRRRLWEGLYPPLHVIVTETPVDMTAEYLDYMLDTDTATYGVIDYLLFSVRGLFHLFGRSTRNAGGVICSEMVANDMQKHGWRNSFYEVPSPADLELAILGKLDAINP